MVPDGKFGEGTFGVIPDVMKDKGRVAFASIVLAKILAIEKEMVGLAAHIPGTKAGHFDAAKFKADYEAGVPILHRLGHRLDITFRPEHLQRCAYRNLGLPITSRTFGWTYFGVPVRSLNGAVRTVR